MRFRSQFGRAGRDHGSWPVLLLMLLAVLVPTACVLWLMSEAVNNQRDIAHRQLTEAYRRELALVRDRLDSYWERRASDLERHGSLDTPSVVFERYIDAHVADSIIYLGPGGQYPSLVPPAADPTEGQTEWAEAGALENRGEYTTAAAAYSRMALAAREDSIAARALQAEIRCFVRSGNREAALRIIQRQFDQNHWLRAVDLQGRLIAGDEQLLALHLMNRNDRRFLPAARRLHATLANYGISAMPSAQRLFLMQEMRTLQLDYGLSDFRTYEAEQVASRFLDVDHAQASGSALRLSALPDVWKLNSPNSKIIGLFRTQTVLAAMNDFLGKAATKSNDSQFTVTPPGMIPARFEEGIPAGSRLPGWQITLALGNDRPLDRVARRQVASYVWVGFLTIAAMSLLALIIGQSFRRQIRLAHMKTDLVATVSHELKTPLSSMRLLVDLLLDDQEFDPRKTREYLELIARENVRLSRLIDNFLTFSRIERGRRNFEFTEIMPSEVIQAVSDAANERFPSAECRLEVNASPDLPPLSADKDALVTVLLNLIENAYKFTPGKRRICLRAYMELGYVCFAVDDNGIGIPAREQKRVFRRFYQVDRQLARQSGGCGLGLSIVEFIVRAHNGSVQVKSQPGAGSTFTISLPCAATAKGAMT